MDASRGRVDLVGAGPGDPGLITRRGADALARADVVIYDHLACARLLDLAPASALRISAGKRANHATMAQDEINRALVEHARLGRRVVRLKGGDPFVFGRGGEEVEFLRDHGVPFRVVPGVTAGLGATAYAGIPVTHRGVASAVAFVTGHDDPARPGGLDWSTLARFPGTLVVYMGVTRLESICRTLIAEGKPAETPAALVRSGTSPGQETVVGTLADLAARAGIAPPALLIVGEVVARRPGLDWFEGLPLFGRRIVVTRPADEAGRSVETLEALGAEALLAPMVRILPPEDFKPLDDAIRRIESFDWLAFTSSNGVRHFLDRLDAVGLDLRALGRVKVAAIGPATAETLREYRLNADLIPTSHRSEGLVEALASRVAGRRILLAKADRGRALLAEELGRIAEVEQVTAYRNVDAESIPPEILGRIEDGSVDWVILTSPAIAERFHGLLSDRARERIGGSVRLASLSPVTSAAIDRLGWPVAVEASVFTWDGLLEAIADRVRAEG